MGDCEVWLEGAEVKEPRIRPRPFVRVEVVTAGAVACPVFVAAGDGAEFSAFSRTSPKAEGAVTFSS